MSVFQQNLRSFAREAAVLLLPPCIVTRAVKLAQWWTQQMGRCVAYSSARLMFILSPQRGWLDRLRTHYRRPR
jgi:hypothetical protein